MKHIKKEQIQGVSRDKSGPLLGIKAPSPRPTLLPVSGVSLLRICTGRRIHVFIASG